MKADNATYWHDTYQDEVNARDEFFGDLLSLLPGAENEGMDAYDQIPRAIKALKAERDDYRDRCGAQVEAGVGLVEEMRKVEAERDALKAELAEARAAIERVQALHFRNANSGGCEYCSDRDYPNYFVPWPCDAIAALDAPQRPEDTREEPGR